MVDAVEEINLAKRYGWRLKDSAKIDDFRKLLAAQPNSRARSASNVFAYHAAMAAESRTVSGR